MQIPTSELPNSVLLRHYAVEDQEHKTYLEASATRCMFNWGMLENDKIRQYEIRFLEQNRCRATDTSLQTKMMDNYRNRLVILAMDTMLYCLTFFFKGL